MEAIYRLNRLALVTMMAFYVPSILAIIGVLLYGGYLLTMAAFGFEHRVSMVRMFAPFLALSLDLTLLGVCFLLAIGLIPLLFRTARMGDEGLVLEEEDHPSLFALIDRFAKRLNTHPPAVVYLTPFADASINDLDVVNEDGSVTKRVRTLCIGAGLVIHLRADEFMTVLCHEMAHAAAGDTVGSITAGRFFGAMESAVQLHTWEEDPEGPSVIDRLIRLGLLGYYRVFALLYLLENRRREYAADHLAATICGAQKVRDMLIRVHLPGRLPALSLEALFLEYSQNQMPMENLYDEHRRRWRELSPVALSRAENEMFLQKQTVWDSHPALARRLKNTVRVKSKELELDKPATKLFRNWRELERKITQVLITWGRMAFERHLHRLDLDLRESHRY